MITENLSTLKIHKLTQEQYDRELASGNIDENALYLTPDVVTDVDELIDMMNEYKEETTNEINSINENIENRLEEIQGTIPTKTSQLTNDSSFVNQTGLNTALEDKLSFDEEVVNSTSDVIKVVPEGSGKYAAVNKVGGMSYKSSNLLDLPEEVTLTTAGYVAQEVPVLLSAGKSYSLSYMQVGGTNCTLTLNTASGGFSFTTIAAAMVGRSSTIIEPTENIVSISFKLGGAGTFSQCMLNEGTTALTYEPYYSGLRNSYVSEIKSIVSKNLLNISGLTERLTNGKLLGVSLTISNDGLIIANGTATGNGGRTKSNASITLEKGTYKMSIYDTDGKSLSTAMAGVYLTYANDTNTHISNAGVFEVTEKTTFIFGVNVLEGKTYNESFYVMICRAEETNKSYEPYKENTFTIPTGARGVGYGMGVNEDCYNYIDFERKVYVRNCAKVNFNGINWLYDTSRSRFYCYGETGLKPGSTLYFTSYYVNGETVGNTPCFSMGDYAYYVNDDRFTNADDFKAWLSTNPVTVIFELATPIETDISDYIQDNFIEVAEGGVITAVNEYNYNVPTEYEFYTSENPEKVIVADKFVGDLVGIAEEAQSLTGLTATVDELNYSSGLTGNIQEQLDSKGGKGQSGTGTNAEIFNFYTKNKANGDYSHAEGYITTASGTSSHAEGYGTTASASSSHAEGSNTTASGNYSHAEGAHTTASGHQSHTGGYGTTASGMNSFSHGGYINAQGYAQAVFGKYNALYDGATGKSDATGSIFIVGVGTSDTARANAFRITNAGQCVGSQSFATTGADYAEYYEWEDGNPNNEDRRGHFVTFAKGRKVRIANSEDDYILGVISADPSVIGNAYTDSWQGMHLTDVFGERLTEVIEIEEEEIKDEEGNVIETIPAHTETRFILNPDYDPEQEYVGRNERQEWAIVGTHGQLVVIDDGSCQVNKYCKVSDNGIAIHSDEKTEYRIVERLDDTHIRIVIK